MADEKEMMGQVYSDIGSLLSYKKKGGTEFVPLYHVTATPKMGAENEQLDTTVIYSQSKSSIQGRQNLEGMEFTCIIAGDPDSTFAHLVALSKTGEEVEWKFEASKKSYADAGIYSATWQGSVSVSPNEVTVNKVNDATFNVSVKNFEIALPGEGTPTVPGKFNPDNKVVV